MAATVHAEEVDRRPGDGAAVVKSSLYVDDDDTTVATALVDADVELPFGLALGGHLLVDSISSASVDVVTAATPGFAETRVETGAGLRLRAPGRLDLGLDLVRSVENDWESASVQLSAGRELAERNSRLSVGYAFTRNDARRADDPTFADVLDVHTLELGATQLLDRRTLGSAAYTVQLSDGLHSSPYRYVTTADGRFSSLETHPRSRVRHAVTLRVLRDVAGAGVDLSYRLYADDWGIVSHTVVAAATFPLGERFDLRLRARGYLQSAADFWQERYQAPAVYMSLDRELSTFWDAAGGAKLAWHSGRWVVDAKIDLTYYRFLDFAPLAGRLAAVGDVGVGATW